MVNPQDNGSQANVDKGTRVDIHLGRQKFEETKTANSNKHSLIEVWQINLIWRFSKRYAIDCLHIFILSKNLGGGDPET